LVKGFSGIEVNSVSAIGDPAIVAMRDKVHAAADPALAPDAAQVSVTTATGTRLRADIEHCLGSATRPMSDRDLEDKFRGLCDGVIEGHRVDQLIAACWRLDKLPDVAEIAQLAA
jgi:2-methylcitrate dehydratase PrpD